MAKNSLLSTGPGDYWWTAELSYEAKAPGVVLIRAVDINSVDKKGGLPVEFAQLTHSGVQAVGPVETEVTSGGSVDWHPEAAFYAPVSSGQSLKLMYRLGVAYQGSCVGWQFDGPGFSENIVTSSPP